MGYNPTWLCPYEKGKFGPRDMHTHRENAMWRWRQKSGWWNRSHWVPKTASKPLGCKRGVWNRFSLPAPRRHQLCWHLGLELLASRSYSMLLLCHPVRGTLLCSPSKLMHLITFTVYLQYCLLAGGLRANLQPISTTIQGLVTCLMVISFIPAFILSIFLNLHLLSVLLLYWFFFFLI